MPNRRSRLLQSGTMFTNTTSLRIFCLAGCLAVGGTAAAQDAIPAHTIGIALFSPNVMETGGTDPRFEGFDIDLWAEISRMAGVEYELRKLPFEQLLEEVKNGAVHAGIAGITMTASRERDMDFSYPYMQSGLRIMARVDEQPALIRFLRSVPTSGVLEPIGYLVAFLVVCAHVLFLAERGSKAIHRNYFPGILESAWCILATMTTVGYGDITPHRWMGRFVAMLVMVMGIGLFSLIIAQLSAGITLAGLDSGIRGPEDLRDRAVATVAGSTSVEALHGYGALVREVPVIEQAYGLLRTGAVDAVVFDAPPLLLYVKEHPGEPVALVGPLLNKQSYGIAFPPDSPLREPVNRALLELSENGASERLYKKWFGEAP